MKATTRFAIVNLGRTGSTLLVDLLHSHPAIECDGEVLNDIFWQGWRRPLLWVTRAWPSPYLDRRAGRAARPVYGFKLKTGGQVYHLHTTLRNLQHRGWRLIYLHRRDTLQQTFSWSVAQVSGRWQRRIGQPSRALEMVTLNVDEFMRNLGTCIADHVSLAAIMHDLPHLPLVYEDDLQCSDQWPATSERVCAWLGVAPLPLTSQVVKTWDRSYRKVVTNYDEIITAVARSSFRDVVIPPADKAVNKSGYGA